MSRRRVPQGLGIGSGGVVGSLVGSLRITTRIPIGSNAERVKKVTGCGGCAADFMIILRNWRGSTWRFLSDGFRLFANTKSLRRPAVATARALSTPRVARSRRQGTSRDPSTARLFMRLPSARRLARLARRDGRRFRRAARLQANAFLAIPRAVSPRTAAAPGAR